MSRNLTIFDRVAGDMNMRSKKIQYFFESPGHELSTNVLVSLSVWRKV